MWKFKKKYNCPNEQVVALLSVIASNFATTPEKGLKIISHGESLTRA